MPIDERLSQIKKTREIEKSEGEKKEKAEIEESRLSKQNQIDTVQRLIPMFDKGLISGLIKIGSACFDKPVLLYKTEQAVKRSGSYALLLMDLSTSDDVPQPSDNPRDAAYISYYRGIQISLTATGIDCRSRTFNMEDPDWDDSILDHVLSIIESGKPDLDTAYPDYSNTNWRVRWSTDLSKVYQIPESEEDKTIWMLMAAIFWIVTIFCLINGY